MEINVFGVSVKLSAVALVCEETVLAGHIPNPAECMGNNVVYFADVLRTELMAHDIIVKTDSYELVAADLGECFKQGLTVLATALPNTNLLVRFYRSSDWPCAEHPEILMYQPIGMYHCPQCGEMQVAGTLHLPKQDLSEAKVT